jgi:hypothetical protein
VLDCIWGESNNKLQACMLVQEHKRCGTSRAATLPVQVGGVCLSVFNCMERFKGGVFVCVCLYGKDQTTLQVCRLHWFKSMNDVTHLEPPLNACR